MCANMKTNFVGMQLSTVKKILPESVTLNVLTNESELELTVDKNIMRLNLVIDKNNKVIKVIGYF